jgi:RES domain-containing protein
MEDIPTRTVKGRFYRAIRADRVEHLLDAPLPDSAGRYHRHGEPALYLTAEHDWAVIALGSYMAEDGLPRVVVPLEITEARVFDQHDEAACAALGINRERSNTRWRLALDEGREPESWANSDAVRAAELDGIIDRSRGISGGWHVALFRWNERGGPNVRVTGDPVVADYAASRSRWDAPTGWTMPAFETHKPRS